jgi:hypothetical protein
MVAPENRIYYAHRRMRPDTGKVSYFHASPNLWWVELHGSPDPIVELRLREWRDGDPPSPYWGWISVRHPEEYSFVWPSELQLEMCFPGGSKIVEDLGEGRKVHLVVDEVAPRA